MSSKSVVTRQNNSCKIQSNEVEIKKCACSIKDTTQSLPYCNKLKVLLHPITLSTQFYHAAVRGSLTL